MNTLLSALFDRANISKAQFSIIISTTGLSGNGGSTQTIVKDKAEAFKLIFAIMASARASQPNDIEVILAEFRDADALGMIRNSEAYTIWSNPLVD